MAKLQVLGLELKPPTPLELPPQGELVKTEEIPQEYEALCKELGMTSIPIIAARLGLRIYNEKEVHAYLDKKMDYWLWFPLRQVDAVKNFSFHDSDRPYRKAVPLAVLKTVKAITDEVPHAKFFISDEAYLSDFKDPFLMVTPDEGRTRFIVERWDEPSFR